MPMYEYECKKCGHRFEKIEKFTSRVNKKCPKCKKNGVERLISSSAIQFKGTGWYVTDYAGKNSPKEEPKSSSGGTDTSSESVKTEEKSSGEKSSEKSTDKSGDKPKEKKKDKKKD